MRSLASSHPPDDDGVYLAAVEGGGTTFVVSIARVVRHRGDDVEDDIGRRPTTGLLSIGPARLQILDTATLPPRDDATGRVESWTPARIVEATCSFLVESRARHVPGGRRLSAVGVATFGPAGVDPASGDGSYGKILPGSPKREWRGVDLLAPIAEACGIPSSSSSVCDGDGGGRRWVGFDTDVNAPALAEFRHRRHLRTMMRTRVVVDGGGGESYGGGGEKPLTSLSYVTIGTGVGVGLIVNSMPVHGLLHPEGGHVAIRPLDGDDFDGYSWGRESSPYGGRGTVEGVASSVALTERYLRMTEGEKKKKKTTTTTGRTSKDDDDDVDDNDDDDVSREVLSTLPDDHPIWDHASNAIANLCVSILLLTSCQKIVLGGGVMKRHALYGAVRSRVWTLLNGYLDSVYELGAEERLDDVIVGGSWAEVGSGLVGAFALALDAYDDGIIAEGGGGGGGRGREANNGGGEEAKKDDVGSIAASPDEGGRMTAYDERRRSFVIGVLAGMGLAFGCALVTSVFSRGMRQRR